MPGLTQTLIPFLRLVLKTLVFFGGGVGWLSRLRKSKLFSLSSHSLKFLSRIEKSSNSAVCFALFSM